LAAISRIRRCVLTLPTILPSGILLPAPVLPEVTEQLYFVIDGGITKMATIKTAVSLQEQLFKQAGAMARDMKLSRSRLVAVALEEFIQRHYNRELLEKINEAYGEKPDPAERKYMKKMRRRHRKIVDGPW
jgi:hypothetical protein